MHKTLPRLKVSWSVNVVSLVIATSNIQLCKSLSEMFRDLHMLAATCAKHSKKKKKTCDKLVGIFKSHKSSTTPKWNTHCSFSWLKQRWYLESTTTSFRVLRLLSVWKLLGCWWINLKQPLKANSQLSVRVDQFFSTDKGL